MLNFIDLAILAAAGWAIYALTGTMRRPTELFSQERLEAMSKKRKPQDENELEAEAKRMAEYYYAKREKMGARGIEACLHRVSQENSGLYAHLNREWVDLLRTEKRERRLRGDD